MRPPGLTSEEQADLIPAVMDAGLPACRGLLAAMGAGQVGAHATGRSVKQLRSGWALVSCDGRVSRIAQQWAWLAERLEGEVTRDGDWGEFRAAAAAAEVWIDAQRAAKAPFFACIPLNAAHGPHVVPEAFASP